MRWPWRRRARGGRVVFIGTSPFDDAAAAVHAVPTPSPVVAAWVPDQPAAPPPPPPPPPPSPAPAAPAPEAVAVPGVQLGFADGTVLMLDDDDPRAVALRAAAARLTGAP